MSEKIYKKLSQFCVGPLLSCLGSRTAAVASLLGRERLESFVEKKIAALFQKALEKSSDVKTEYKQRALCELIILFAQESTAWLIDMQERLHPVRNKKERKKRRHRPQSSLDFDELFQKVFEKLHVLLSAESELLASVDIQQDRLQALLFDRALSRENKVCFLYWLFSTAYYGVHGLKRGKSVAVFAHVLEPHIEPLAQTFFPSFTNFSRLLPKKAASEKLLSLLLSASGSIDTLESLNTMQVRSEGELDRFVERIAQDERFMRTLLYQLFPNESAALPDTESLLSMLSFGLQASATHLMGESILTSTNWQQVLLTFLERLRLFVLSPYFDRWLLRSTLHLLSCPDNTVAL